MFTKWITHEVNMHIFVIDYIVLVKHHLDLTEPSPFRAAGVQKHFHYVLSTQAHLS